MLRIELMGVQSPELPLDGRLDKLEDGLKGVLLLRTVEFVAVYNGVRIAAGRPPGRPGPVHRLTFAVRNADQVSDLHLPEAQGNIATVDLAADLDDSSRLTDAAMADHAGG